MKLPKAIDLFPDAKDDDWFCVYDWDVVINAFGEPVVLYEAGSYQGSYYIIYKKDGAYGYAQFAYGSCSGCDALQCCSSYEAVDETIEDSYASIVWFDNPEELVVFLFNRDWGFVTPDDIDELKNFIVEAMFYLLMENYKLKHPWMKRYIDKEESE